MSNILLHPIAAGHPGRIQRIEAETGLTARPIGRVVVLEGQPSAVYRLRDRARFLMRHHRASDQPPPDGAA